VVLHLGGSRYKLYYEARQGTTNEVPKPLRVLYIDGGSDVNHWEDEARAREVHFRWPDGTQITEGEESGLGDHVIYYPTSAPDHQVMYLNLGGFDNPDDPTLSNGVGMAVLLNP
jgi:hypothetical protein